MASKAKIQSMQRGALHREDAELFDKNELYRKHPPQIANSDKPHLDFIRFKKTERVPRILSVIKAARANGIGTASEVSGILNKIGVLTAIDEKWSPRLVWFAASAILQNDAQVRSLKHRNNSGSKSPPDRAEFERLVSRTVRSRLSDIQEGFHASRSALGDAAPELSQLLKTMQSGD